MKSLFPSSKRNTITGRIIAGFFVSTLIPMVVITLILCVQFEHNESKAAQEEMKISGALVANLLSGYFNNLDKITMTPYYSGYFSSRSPITPSDADYQSEYLAWSSEMQQLFNLSTYSSADILDLIVWSDGLSFYHTLYNERLYPVMLQNVQKQPWYEHTISKGGEMAFTQGADQPDGDILLKTDSFYVTRQIRNLRNPDQINLIILRLGVNTIASQLADLNLLHDSFVVVTNECDDLIYTSLPLTAETLEDVLSCYEFRESGTFWRSEAFPIPQYDLNVHVVYSMDAIYRHIASMVLYAAAIYLVVLLTAYLVFRWHSRWISGSVQPLLDTFSRIEKADMETHCQPLDVEEFDALSRSVNEMMDQLNEKIRNEYLLIIQQKSLQLYALQSQIQPHFLNNTLYCFIALNQLEQRDTLNSALYSLSHLLRYVLSKERYTTVGREYEFLEDYLKLQKLRFADRLSYSFDCPDDLRALRIPRLLLQPLVENAIIHGVEPSEAPCFCRCSCGEHEGNLILTVSNNGAGFEGDVFERKLKEAAAVASDPASDAFQSSTREKSSIGLYYVKERLNMWSTSASMRAVREDDTTTVEIAVPMEDTTHEIDDR